MNSFNLKSRFRAACIHFLVSLLIIFFASLLVFGLWFPGIYRKVAGGRDLFILIASVDVVLGPLLTFVVFNLKKGWTHLRRDLTFISFLQLSALIYGLITVYNARPVGMIFEVDRFRVVTVGQIEIAKSQKSQSEYQLSPFTQPRLLGTRTPTSDAELDEALTKGIEGVDLAQRPQFWQPYVNSIPQVLKRARPLSVLLVKYPHISNEVNNELRDLKVDVVQAKFLPLMGRGGDWVAIIDGKGQPVHYAQVDGFF
jgi:hypothetical protein